MTERNDPGSDVSSPDRASDQTAAERYFLAVDVEPLEWREVTKEQFIQAEKQAGFTSFGPPGSTATGGFSGHGVRGRVTLSEAETSAEQMVAHVAETDVATVRRLGGLTNEETSAERDDYDGDRDAYHADLITDAENRIEALEKEIEGRKRYTTRMSAQLVQMRRLYHRATVAYGRLLERNAQLCKLLPDAPAHLVGEPPEDANAEFDPPANAGTSAEPCHHCHGTGGGNEPGLSCPICLGTGFTEGAGSSAASAATPGRGEAPRELVSGSDPLSPANPAQDISPPCDAGEHIRCGGCGCDCHPANAEASADVPAVDAVIFDALFHKDPKGHLVYRWSDDRMVFSYRDALAGAREVRLALEHFGKLRSEHSEVADEPDFRLNTLLHRFWGLEPCETACTCFGKRSATGPSPEQPS